MFKIKKASKSDFFENWPKDWPSKVYYVSQHDVTEEQYRGFKELIESRASETDIEKFLANNKEVLSLSLLMFSTGHHATWIFPKQYIRPPSGAPGGMIPDYLMAGSSSSGLSWWMLELKGANHDAFKTQGKRVFLSSEANKGVCQLINYIDISTRSQCYLRDELKLSGYREPKGILLIGTNLESSNEQVREFKGAWNRMNPQIQIRSYSALLDLVGKKLENRRKG